MLTPMVGYAAAALGYLAMRPDEPIRVREIAEVAGVPEPYLAKILHRLSRFGLVASRRGIGGGVTLAVDARRVTLLDLCRVLGDPILRPQCLLGGGECSDDEACPAHDFQQRIRARQLEFLASTSMHDIGTFDAAKRRRAARTKSKGARRTRGAVGLRARGARR